MRVLLFILCFFEVGLCLSQPIPPERIVDWSKVGLVSEPNIPNISIDFVVAGGDNTGLTSNDSLLQYLLNQHPNFSIKINFPSGTYLFKQSIHLQNNRRLIGVSADSTFLKFNLSNEDHLIKIQGTATSDTTKIVSPMFKGDDNINVFNSNEFNIGDVVHILPMDNAFIFSEWARQSTGQICQIIGIDGNTLELDAEIRRDYGMEENPFIQKVNPIENVGIEKINMTRTNPTINQTSHIFMNYAHNCWVRCIQSYECNFGHVTINKSSHIEVSGSHFQEAFDYGNGGKAYGVVLQSTSSECLITNNTFDQLRHAMLLQSGANGNVVSYNYSQHPFWTDVSLPSDSAGDLVLHGNYPYANLLEGNVVQNIVIDDSHHTNGSFNTFFRNRAEGYGIFMNNAPPSDQQNFIGNEITRSDFPYGLYFLQGNDHFEYGNQTPSTIIPENTNDLTLPSLYLMDAPSFLENTPFPPIGFPNDFNAHQIPAQQRWLDNHLTACGTNKNEEPTATNNIKRDAWVIYPNPSTDVVSIINLNQNIAIDFIEITDLNGRVLNTQKDALLDISSFPKGLLLFNIHHSNGQITIKKLLHM